MNKTVNRIFLGIVASLLVVGCGTDNSSASQPSISDTTSISDATSDGTTSEPISSSDDTTSDPSDSLTSEGSSSSEEGEGNIVGTPISPGEVPPYIDIYFNPGGIDFDKYQLWLWDEGGTDGKAYNWTIVEGDWAYFRIDTSLFKTVNGIYLIIRSVNSWAFQTSDAYIKYSDFGQTDGVLSVYTIIGDGNVLEFYGRAADALGDRIISADFLSFTTLEVTSTAQPSGYELYIDDVFAKAYTASSASDVLTLDKSAELQKRYEIRATYESHNKTKVKLVSPRALYKTPSFTSAFTYNEDDLGATYSEERTTFKLWAPTSTAVRLHIYNYGSPSTLTGNILSDTPNARYDMVLGANGVWSYTVEGDLNLKFYTYRVTNSNGVSEVVDPYAKNVGVNGLRGQVIDFDRYETSTFKDIDAKLTPIAAPTDLVVYEMHVADLTTDENWNGSEDKRGKYLGLIEEGTTYTSGETTVTTGFDHLKELGVNAIQLMPFYDQSNYEIPRTVTELDENDEPVETEVPPGHNWGYNPLNFNALEGSYASNPYRGEVRVQEFKQVVETFADNDIRIIMDVVYNHVASASASNFNKIVPGYYFRYNQDWSLNNDSGVGNVFASENKMAAKFIADSVLFWAEEFNIKGFRFDLMELIADETMILIDQTLAENGFDDVVIWGEPWDAAGHYSGGYKVNRGSLANTRVGAFNDQGRNGLKGENSIRHNSHWGWINKGILDNEQNPDFMNKTKGMLAGINGSYYGDKLNNNPSKNVQYAGSHDNFALFDQMLFSFGGNEELAMRAATTANSIVLTSLGIPFFQGGDEIGRTKPFDETSEAGAEFIATHFYESAELNDQFYSGNSYNIGYETNRYRWADKVKWLDYFNAYKNLINFRLSEEGQPFRLKTATEASNNFRHWENTIPPLSWAAMATENKIDAASYTSSGAIYSFYVGRLAENDSTVETFNFGSGQVKVLFDSKGELTGQTLSSPLTLERFRVVIVERI